jgi:hypothetical protein
MKIRIREDLKLPSREEIQKAFQEIIQEETKAKNVDKPKTPLYKPNFPMDYILFKFPDIKRVLTEVLTTNFRDFIYNIYVIAPKPTTLKVVLKNKQNFLLIYEERSYIIKASGKKYYLLNIGELQRATKAIANLLNAQKFTTNKADTDESESDSDSSSSKSSGGGGGGGNFPGSDSGGEEGDKGEEGSEDLPPLPPELTKGGLEGGDETPKEGGEDEELPKNLRETKLRIKLK